MEADETDKTSTALYQRWSVIWYQIPISWCGSAGMQRKMSEHSWDRDNEEVNYCASPAMSPCQDPDSDIFYHAWQRW